MEQAEVHETAVLLLTEVPTQIDAGTDIGLKIRISCPSNCDLQGGRVRIVDAQGGKVAEVESLSFGGAANETDEFVVKAPIEPGIYTWMAVFPELEKEGFLHRESSTPLSFIVKPHATSIAVWDVPSPIVSGTKFRLKVGAKCPVECRLAGMAIEVYNHEGAKVAAGVLGDVPLPGTSALYWAEVEAQAPDTEGFYKWVIKFPKPHTEIEHVGASCTFGFGTARAPEYVVAVEVIAKDTKSPIENAQVTLHSCGSYPYRGCTDVSGVSRISVPRGDYELHIAKNDREPFQGTVTVAGDVTVKAELLVRVLKWWE